MLVIVFLESTSYVYELLYGLYSYKVDTERGKCYHIQDIEKNRKNKKKRVNMSYPTYIVAKRVSK